MIRKCRYPIAACHWLILSAILFSVLPTGDLSARTTVKVYRLGLFQGGEHPVHGLLRDSFRRQLRDLAPDSMRIDFAAEAYKSAEWDRELSRKMAQELAESNIDLVVSYGPWTVEDLLAAGFERPIVAMYRFDPVGEGLLDSIGRPAALNVTLHYDPQKIPSDLQLLTRVKPISRLGLLVFKSKDDPDRVTDRILRLGQRMGIEIVTAQEYNRKGAFAFFKAYRSLSKPVDALYCSPMWDFNGDKMTQFFVMTNADRVPVMTSEGRFVVERGALISSERQSLTAIARFMASKTIRILSGEKPADLPVSFVVSGGLTVNEGIARTLNLNLPNDILYAADVIPAEPDVNLPQLRVNDAIALALAGNSGYLATLSTLEMAAASVSMERSQYLPQLTLDGSVGYIDNNAVANSQGRFDNSRYRASLTLRQTLLSLETLKHVRMTKEKASLDMLAQQQAALDLEFAVSAAFVNQVRATNRLKTTREYLRYINSKVESARARQLLGEDGGAIHVFWLVEQSLGRADVTIATADMKNAGVIMNVLLNRPGYQPLLLDTTNLSSESLVRQIMQFRQLLPDEEKVLQASDFLVRQAISVSPELSSHNSRVNLQKLRLGKNRAAFFPKIGFQASLNYVDSLRNFSGFSEKQTTWEVAGWLKLPLYLGGRRHAERRSLRAGLDRFEYVRDDARVRRMGEIYTEANDLFSNLYSLPALGQAAEQAQTFRELSVDFYGDNSANLIDQRDALRSARNARLQYINAHSSFRITAAQLVHRVGWSLNDSSLPPIDLLISRLSGALQEMPE